MARLQTVKLDVLETSFAELSCSLLQYALLHRLAGTIDRHDLQFEGQKKFQSCSCSAQNLQYTFLQLHSQRNTAQLCWWPIQHTILSLLGHEVDADGAHTGLFWAQYLMFCLFTVPERWKCASSLITRLFINVGS